MSNQTGMETVIENHMDDTEQLWYSQKLSWNPKNIVEKILADKDYNVLDGKN